MNLLAFVDCIDKKKSKLDWNKVDPSRSRAC
jgi:hypothetical protein